MIKSCFEVKQHSLLINSYWFYGDLLMLIDKVDKNKYWLLNKYTNIKSPKYNSPFGVFLYNYSYKSKLVEYYDCPFIEFQKIMKSSDGKIFNMDIINFIKYEVDLGGCTLLMADRSYISGYNISSRNSYHEIMIYGYDDESKTVFFCDNDSDGTYRTDLSCSYNEMASAYNNFQFHSFEIDHNHSVFSLMPREDEKYKLNHDEIKTGIEEYLLLKTDYTTRDSNIEWECGINIYNQFYNYFSDILKNEREFSMDIRSFHLFWDHKKAMLHRLEYFSKNHLVNDSQLPIEYSKICNSALIVRNLTLKARIANSEKLFMHIIELLKVMQEEEIRLLTHFLKCM